MTHNKKVLLVGGGTAGHVNPLLVVAQELKKQGHTILSVGTKQGLEHDILPKNNIPIKFIPKVPLPRKICLDLLYLPFRLHKANKLAKQIVGDFNPAVIIGFGGYVSVPVYRAAKQTNTPLIIHEANAIAGVANKYGAKFAKTIITTFSSTKFKQKSKIRKFGLPLKPSIIDCGKNRKAQSFQLNDPKSVHILVTGGSLGALKLNQTVTESVKDLVSAGAKITHITGKGKLTTKQLELAKKFPNYTVIEYTYNIEKLYKNADLCISRSGAGMVCELASLGMPSVLVPLPIGNGEQEKNAHDLVQAKGAILVKDKEFTKEWLENSVISLIKDPKKIEQMAKNAYLVAKQNATELIVNEIEKV